MKVYLLFIRDGKLITCAAIYSSKENAENEVESGEFYQIVETELDRNITLSPRNWKTKQ